MKTLKTALVLALITTAAHAAGRSMFDSVPGQWWSPMWAAKWGGVIGGGFGSLCGILGGLAGWLAPQGRAKGFILGAWNLMVAVSVVSLIAGITALVMRQPYFVYYPLLLCGFIGAVVGGSLTKMLRLRYHEAELRKMNAQDAVGN